MSIYKGCKEFFISQTCMLASLLLLIVVISAQAQTVLTAAQLQNSQSVELDKLGWKYSPDDDPRFADPQFDDTAWETLHGTAITLDRIPKSGWHGLGWFRLRLQADPALANQPLALVLVHFGASEIYLNGKLIERFGTVGATPATEEAYNPNLLPSNIVLDGRSEHVLAIRHSCQAMRNLESGWGRLFVNQSVRIERNALTNGAIGQGAGFGIRIEELRQALAQRDHLQSEARAAQMRVSLFLVIGLLHLLLYWFYPRQRGNLFYGLFAWSAVSANLSLIPLYISHWDIPWTLTSLLVSGLSAFSFIPAFLLGFLYATFSLPPSRAFWGWVILTALNFPVDVAFPPQTGLKALLGLLLALFPIIEVVRVRNRLAKMKTANAEILSAAILLFILVNFLSIFITAGVVPGAAFTQTAWTIAAAIIAIFFSAFLARQFARTSLNLEEKLGQVEELSAKELESQRREAELRLQHEKEKAENERRAKELEEARQLQLSMLPKSVPQLPHLEIAAYMKTATEVGGDYYDFHLAADGTLTIAVGDATGHGMRAGTLVASIKSLFVSLAYHPDIPHIFQRISAVLKEMKLRGLFMAMTMVKVKGNQMSVSIAGMPSVLIYRAQTGDVEEVVMRALPLGGMTKYQYQQQEVTLAANDVVVLMSDGLPERFNPRDEMLDYERIQQALPALAARSAEAIIAALMRLGEDWSEGRAQDDDITFVVLKLRSV